MRLAALQIGPPRQLIDGERELVRRCSQARELLLLFDQNRRELGAGALLRCRERGPFVLLPMVCPRRPWSAGGGGGEGGRDRGSRMRGQWWGAVAQVFVNRLCWSMDACTSACHDSQCI